MALPKFPSGEATNAISPLDEEDELQALLGFKQLTCAIAGCENEDLDERGPIGITDEKGQTYHFIMCQSHWEAILMTLGKQAGDSDNPYDDEGSDVYQRGWEALGDQRIETGEEDWAETQPSTYAEIFKTEDSYVVSSWTGDAYDRELGGL